MSFAKSSMEKGAVELDWISSNWPLKKCAGDRLKVVSITAVSSVVAFGGIRSKTVYMQSPLLIAAVSRLHASNLLATNGDSIRATKFTTR